MFTLASWGRTATSNYSLGFTSDRRRINVFASRARKQFILFMSEHLSPSWSSRGYQCLMPYAYQEAARNLGTLLYLRRDKTFWQHVDAVVQAMSEKWLNQSNPCDMLSHGTRRRLDTYQMNRVAPESKSVDKTTSNDSVMTFDECADIIEVNKALSNTQQRTLVTSLLEEEDICN